MYVRATYTENAHEHMHMHNMCICCAWASFIVFLCNFRDLTQLIAMLGLRLVSSVAAMLVATMLRWSTDEVALTGPKVELRKFARRFSSSVKVNGDIDVRRFVSAGEEFSHAVERFGDFTRRGVVDARKNLKRVEKAAGGRVVSMQALLRDELRRGSRHPKGGPARSTGAEALLWSRLSVSFWVEIFKEHLRGKTSLPDATRSGLSARSPGTSTASPAPPLPPGCGRAPPTGRRCAGIRTSAARTGSARTRHWRRS